MIIRFITYSKQQYIDSGYWSAETDNGGYRATGKSTEEAVAALAQKLEEELKQWESEV